MFGDYEGDDTVMSETIEMFGQRIGQETGLGKPPLFIDGQTRLALMNLSHEAFCLIGR